VFASESENGFKKKSEEFYFVQALRWWYRAPYCALSICLLVKEEEVGNDMMRHLVLEGTTRPNPPPS
jgi:hypothetical protein